MCVCVGGWVGVGVGGLVGVGVGGLVGVGVGCTELGNTCLQRFSGR